MRDDDGALPRPVRPRPGSRASRARTGLTARQRAAAVVAVIATGAAVRIWLYTTALGIVDGDEAVVGLMARDWRRGEASTFYWGQFYGGSQESLLTALLFEVLSPAAAMKAVPVLLHAAGTVVAWRIGRRTVGPRAALMGASLMWMSPAAFVWGSTKARGQYGTTLVCGLVAVLLIVRLAQDEPGLAQRVLIAGGTGLAAGIGWWASPQVALTVLPAGAWLVWSRRGRALPDLLFAAPAAVAGALPWIRFNLSHSFASLRLPPVIACSPPYGGRVEAAITSGLPRAIGARLPYSGGWEAAPLAVLACLGFAALVAAAAMVAVRDRERGLALVVVVIAAYPLLFALSPFFYVDEPRYFYFLSPYVALLVGWAAARAPKPVRTSVVVVGLAVIVSVVSLATMAGRGVGRFAAGGVLVPRDLGPVVDALRDRGVATVITPYALAYRITLDSNETVVATPIEHIRDAGINRTVRTSETPAWLFLDGSKMARRFERAVRRRGADPGCAIASGAVVCTPDRTFLQEDLPELQPGYGEPRKRC